MAQESLDSDKVNYLVWRHMVEAGYLETAQRLQKEWRMEDPQLQCVFAPHVTNHALVSLLNKGLLYQAAEREAARATTDVVEPQRGIFGILDVPASPPALNDEDLENARKHQFDEDAAQFHEGPPGKKARLSNGHGHGNGNGNGNVFDHDHDHEYAPAVAMDVDNDLNGDGHAYPSPEQIPSPQLATSGPDRATQVDHITDLSLDATFLNTTGRGANNSTVVLQCEFHPQDSTILAAAGTDTLAHLWTLAPPTPDLEHHDLDVKMENGLANGHPDGHVSADAKFVASRAHSVFPLGSPSDVNIESIAWASDGTRLLVASDQVDECAARIDMWSSKGQHIDTSPGLESPVVAMRWNLSNTCYLALAPDATASQNSEGPGTAIHIVAVAASEKSCTHKIPEHDMAVMGALDVVWLSDGEFVIGGGEFLRRYTLADGVVKEVKVYQIRENQLVTKLAYDLHSQVLATANESGEIDLYDANEHHHSFNAHTGTITALKWQPIQIPRFFDEESGRLLASSGEDGAICVWNIRSEAHKQKCSMTMRDKSVMALAFSPDGEHIAGAASDQVLIWEIDDVTLPRAHWTRRAEGWQSPQSTDSVIEEDEHLLSWSCDGKKLACASSSTLAVLSFVP